MERNALLIDQIGKGDNVFEQFAIEFEQYHMAGSSTPKLKRLQNKIEAIERRLQDLSEKLTPQIANRENIYSNTIQKTKELLSIWLTVFSQRKYYSRFDRQFDKDLSDIIKYLEIQNIERKSLSEIETDFESSFAISLSAVKAVKKEIISIDVSKLSSEQAYKVSTGIATYVITSVTSNRKKFYGVSHFIPKFSNSSKFEDGEDTLYKGKLKLWIDTNDAAKANKFMSIVAEVLSSIQNVSVEIEDSGKGSFWQDWTIKIKGWFAKEETKQILNKGGKALESYTLDRHIEPIEKSKTERKKTEEEIKRMMDEEDVKILQKLEIEKAKIELESMKLDNINKKLDISEKLSSALASGLMTIDSDYRIEIDGIILLKQEAGVTSLGNIQKLDEKLDKSNDEENN